MDKRAVYERILKVTAEVCDVDVEEMTDGTRREVVVEARSVCIFWLTAVGCSMEGIKGCTGMKSSGWIGAIKARQERMWREKPLYRMMVREVGRRLKDKSEELGMEIDIEAPVEHMRRRTGV